MTKQEEKKGLSLRFKWVLLTVSFLLMMFLLFAFFTYRNTNQIMSIEGQKNITATLNDIETQLAQAEKPLTEEEANRLLAQSVKIEGPKNNPKVTVGNLIAELGQDELYTYIYSAQKKLLTETRPRHNYAQKPLVQKMHMTEIDGMPGFIIGRAIHSKKTGQLVGYVQIFYELKDLNHIRANIFRNLAIFIVLALLLSFICALIISALFLTPIHRLFYTMKVMQQNPMTEERTPLPKDHDELWELTKSSNHMIDQVQRYIQQQEQFVEDVSHELRTPVAIIEGHLQLLNRWGKDDPEVLNESLTASLQEIGRMKSLIQEMLDLTRVDQAELQHLNESCSAKAVVEQVVSNFRMLYPNFSFVLSDELIEDVEVAIYRNHLEQLLVILIDNAVKYSTTKNVVHISMDSNPHHLEIAIQDFGEGICQEDLQKIFDRFYRVDKARSRQKGGNGLGLAIAQKLVKVYEGSLSVESVVNEGTVFHIELPLKKH